jgi:hypothetical protein
MQKLSVLRAIFVAVAVLAITTIGFAGDGKAAESLLVGADKTVSISPTAVGQAVGTNAVTVPLPFGLGVHIYTIQASIADADTVANSGHLRLVHTELRAALRDAGGVFANVIVPLQQEIVGATLSPNFRYRLTMAGAGSGSNGEIFGPAGPTDVLKLYPEFPGRIAAVIDILAVFGVLNNDTKVHPVIVGVNAEVAPF